MGEDTADAWLATPDCTNIWVQAFAGWDKLPANPSLLVLADLDH